MSVKATCGRVALCPNEVNRILDNELVEEYCRLRHTPGFCLEAMPWAKIKQLVEENTEASLGNLGRHPSDIVVYRAFRTKLLSDFASVGDYVKIKKLGYEPVLAEDDRQAAGVCPFVDQGKPYITFLPNDFPYNMHPEVEHHNLWSTSPLSDSEVQQAINYHRDGFETLYWKNPESLASIPSVWHGHVLSRRRCNATH